MNCGRHIATNLNLDPDDFGYAPFLVAPTCPSKPWRSWKLGEGGAQRGGLHGLRSLGEGGGNLSAIASATVEAHQHALRSLSEVGLFGEQLPKLLNELNEVLAA